MEVVDAANMAIVQVSLLWPAGLRAQSLDLRAYRIVDLTHAFDEQTIYWPTSPSKFELKPLAFGKTAGGYFYSSFMLCTPEHGGTHLDAPLHFAEGTVDWRRAARSSDGAGRRDRHLETGGR